MHSSTLYRWKLGLWLHASNKFVLSLISVALLNLAHKCNLDDATLKIVKRIVLFGNCPICFKMMPVGFPCPKCNGEAAQRLHCTKETLELIFREKTNDERIQTILEHPSDYPQANAFRLSEMVNETPLLSSITTCTLGPLQIMHGTSTTENLFPFNRSLTG